MSKGNIQVGLEILNSETIELLAGTAQHLGFQFALSQIMRLSASPLCSSERPLPASLSHADLVLNGPDYAQFCIGGIAHWLDVDSANDHIASNSQTLIQQQVHWAAHIGVPSIMFHCPLQGPIINFARCVNSAASMVSYTKILVRVPLDSASKQLDGWTRWNTVRTLSAHSTKIAVALELGHELPEQAVLDKWLTEPVKVIIIPTNAFITNKRGFPVLSKRHQAFIHQLMRTDRRFVISSPDDRSLHPSGTLASYSEYLMHLHNTVPEPDIVNQFASGYHDYLQAPLQPLMDNLESATYEVFEKDPIKYQQYEEAVYRALVDRAPTPAKPVTVIMVVGAGRGPLVDRSLKAAERANRQVKLYAIEKNSNAIVGLRVKQQTEWGNKVTVVHTDMRYWDTKEKADILVSELLGSFGDNELSPECLDGAQRLISDDGISIPASYTSFVAPLHTPKLFNEASSFNDEEHMETPYVVKFREAVEIAESVPIWRFEHRNNCHMQPPGHPQFNTHNNRYGKAIFNVSQDSVMHGVAGYFESVLYKDVILSIHPKTHSPGMFSWFPLFFPIRSPIFLAKGSAVELHFWRLTDSRKVWYEWSVIPVVNGSQQIGHASAIHNVGGRSSWIGL
eukprot:jgi/Hompol1/5459/HPOL_004446-RA